MDRGRYDSPRGWAASLLFAAALTAAAPVASAKPRRVAAGSKLSLSIGAPNAGSQVRAKRLKKGGGVLILDKSKENSFGHPALVLMLQRSAKQIARANPGAKLLVGDLSAEHGGPLSGHHSHQSGRDADLVFYARDAKGKIVQPSKFVPYGADGRATDGSGLVFDDALNWALVESMARDTRADLAYVFVSRALRARLLAFASEKKRPQKYVDLVTALFMQPENAEPHNDHFHVRIRCPKAPKEVDRCRP